LKADLPSFPPSPRPTIERCLKVPGKGNDGDTRNLVIFSTSTGASRRCAEQKRRNRQKVILVPTEHAWASAKRSILRVCNAGLDPVAFRAEVMRRLTPVLPVDAFWFATADPATLLFTGSLIEAIPEKATRLFVENEFAQTDVNKWTQLAGAARPVNSIYLATEGRPEHSIRYRDICVPLGLGDELRAVLRTGDASWGFMCLHRERNGANFTPAEAAFLAEISPYLAEGLRAALLFERAEAKGELDSPGLLILADDLSLLAATPAGERWLSELADYPLRQDLPQVVYAAVARLTALECSVEPEFKLMPRARVRTRGGQWLVLHASRLTGRGAAEIAVIMEPAPPAELAPLLLPAYGFTRREDEVVQLVLRGSATAGIAAKLRISEYTVQQHLKSIFDKMGVGSRRELVARVFGEQYKPRMRNALFRRH
jgi:DNA-binding CsgD family transcriptional regulator